MGETEVKNANVVKPAGKKNGLQKVLDPSSILQFPKNLQNVFKLNKLGKDNEGEKQKQSNDMLGIDLGKQLQAWRENPSWNDQAPEIKVTVPKGSLCNLNVKCYVGLPPDAVYNIVIDPDNRRVFKNIKEVISRKVLLDEGNRQVVELEQAAIWKFLWWSGTLSVHVLVDQNRQDHTMQFKQLKTGFMKKFEGCWRVEPVYVDEKMCYPFQPKTWEEYCSCTEGKGRIGSKVSLDQLIQPAICPPPPLSWYLRGITSRTTEMIVNDLIAEAARIRGDIVVPRSEDSKTSRGLDGDGSLDIKQRWAVRRSNSKRHH